MKLDVTTPTAAFDSPAAAIAAMIGQLSQIEHEAVDLADASGRVLAQSITADRPSPACDVSAMDGYAVRIADVCLPGTLPVEGEISTGHAPPGMPQGAALRIFTGGAVPEGCDAVIPRELVVEHVNRIELPAMPSLTAGQNIRRRGENLTAGETVVETGCVVIPAVSAALANFGVTRPMVHRRLKLAAIVTGDEVHAPDQPVEPWQLRDSNGPTLASLFSRLQWIEWLGRTHAADNREQLLSTVADMLGRCDALILCGGVSMGDYDLVPGALAELGCRTVFHRLPLRPGRPVLGAIGPAGQAVLGLPGNPVSVMVTARRIALPILRYRAGCAVPDPPAPQVELLRPDSKTLPLFWSRPVSLVAPGQAELLPIRGSGDLVTAARSSGFVELPPGASGLGPWPFYRWSACDE